MSNRIAVKGDEIVFLRGNSEQGHLRCNSKGLLFKPKGSHFEEYVSDYIPKWSQMGSDIDGEAEGDKSGYSISASEDGTTVAIGAIHNDGNGVHSGHTRIYEWYNDTWQQKGTDIDGESLGDLSGYSVSMNSDGTVVAIGAIYNDGVNGVNSGHTRVFEWSSNTWNQRGSDIDGEMSNDLSGYSVSLNNSGSTVAIGAIHNGANDTYTGHTRIYEWNGTIWNQKGSDIDGVTIEFIGYRVCLSKTGNKVAIGSIAAEFPNFTRVGRVQVYKYENGVWSKDGDSIEITNIISSSELNSEVTIYSFSLSMTSDNNSEMIAVGAATELNTHGVARIYDRYGGNWTQRGADIQGVEANDLNGFSVKLCNEGDTISVGAIRNDGADGTMTNVGHVRIYDWKIDQWIQRGDDIYGETINDESGYCVDMNNTGDIVFVSSINNENSRGHVRIFKFE